jgi:hypothetical protein
MHGENALPVSTCFKGAYPWRHLPKSHTNVHKKCNVLKIFERGCIWDSNAILGASNKAFDAFEAVFGDTQEP